MRLVVKYPDDQGMVEDQAMPEDRPPVIKVCCCESPRTLVQDHQDLPSAICRQSAARATGIDRTASGELGGSRCQAQETRLREMTERQNKMIIAAEAVQHRTFVGPWR